MNDNYSMQKCKNIHSTFHFFKYYSYTESNIFHSNIHDKGTVLILPYAIYSVHNTTSKKPFRTNYKLLNITLNMLLNVVELANLIV